MATWHHAEWGRFLLELLRFLVAVVGGATGGTFVS